MPQTAILYRQRENYSQDSQGKYTKHLTTNLDVCIYLETKGTVFIDDIYGTEFNGLRFLSYIIS